LDEESTYRYAPPTDKSYQAITCNDADNSNTQQKNQISNTQNSNNDNKLSTQTQYSYIQTSKQHKTKNRV